MHDSATTHRHGVLQKSFLACIIEDLYLMSTNPYFPFGKWDRFWGVEVGDKSLS